MPHTGEISLRVRSKLTAVQDFGSPESNIDEAFNILFADGTGLGQANNRWADRRTLAGGANEDLDMAGTLSNAFGTALVFTKIKAVIIYAHSTNTVNLTVSRPTTNGLPFLGAAGDAFTLTPGDLFVLTNRTAAGIAVTAGTADLINVAAAAAGVPQGYTVLIFGTT